jgi:hypothetical protein
LWVQLALAILSLSWFGFVAFAVRDDLLVGGKLSIASSAILAAGTAWERLRGLEALGVRLAKAPRFLTPVVISAPQAPT